MYFIKPQSEQVLNPTMFGKSVPKAGFECESIVDFIGIERYNGVKATDDIMLGYIEGSGKWIVEKKEVKKQVKTEETVKKQVKTAKKEG